MTPTATAGTVVRKKPDGSEWTAMVRGGRVVAAATLRDDREVIYLHVDLTGNHRPPGTGTELIEQVFASIQPGPQRRVHASLPFGAPEILVGLRERLIHVQTRPAGASCLVDAILPEDGAPADGAAAKTADATDETGATDENGETNATDEPVPEPRP